MAKASLKDVKVALSRTRSLLIVLPELMTLDTAVAAKLLMELLVTHLNKPTKLLLPENHRIPGRIRDFIGFSEFPADQVVNQVLPLKYNLTLPNVEEGTEVEWKLENSALEITLKTKSGKVDFSKLTFGAKGERYDSVVTLGSQNTGMLNSAYQASADTLAQINTINLDVHPKNEGFGALDVVNSKASTVTEQVFALYKEIGVKMAKDDSDLAKKTVVVSTDGLRRIASSATLTALVELEALAENNVSEVVRSHYHSLGKKGLDLRETMLKNATLDKDSQLLWAHISGEELSKMEIDPSVLDGIEQLPYNICKDVKVATLLYQKGDSWQCVALSNDRSISLFNWAKALGGTGTASIAVAQIKGDLDTVSKTMLLSLKKEVLGAVIENAALSTPVTPEPPAEAVPEEKTETTAESLSSPFTSASEESIKEESAKNSSDKTVSPLGGFQPAKSPFEKAENVD